MLQIKCALIDLLLVKFLIVEYRGIEEVED